MMPWSSLEDRLDGDAINRNMEYKKRRANFRKKNMMGTVLNMLRVPSACWHLESFLQLEMHTILSLVSY